MLKENVKKIFTGILIALEISLLIAGIKAEAAVYETYSGKVPLWFCALPYVIGIFTVILLIIAINKEKNKKISIPMLFILALYILISGIIERIQIPKNYGNVMIFYTLPYIVELVITFFTIAVIRRKRYI